MDSEVDQLHSWAGTLCTRFEQGGGISCIQEAIILGRRALELCPSGHPKRSVALTWLATPLSTRYGQLGSTQDLNEAIALDQEALGLRPEGHPDRTLSLNNLAANLSDRYKQLGTMQDLDEAIDLNREALDLRPMGHRHRSMSLNNLAVDLSTRHEKLGSIQDLNEAIVINREALSLRPKGHPYRLTSLNNLAADLAARYKQLRSIQDLNEAIVLGRAALDLCPNGHPDRPSPLINLAANLSIRYEQLGSIQDLDEAIVLDREALDLCPEGHPGRSISLNNLMVRLISRYKQFGSLWDISEAVVCGREALDLRPKGHPDRSSSLNGLAVALITRYQQLESIQDLNQAIMIGREAFDLCPKGHPDRSRSLENLAGYLGYRFARSNQLSDKEEVFALYTQLAQVTQIVSFADFSVGKLWIRAAEDFQHPTLLPAYETSLRLLVQYVATLPSLPEHLDILKDVTSSLAADAFSAHLRNHSPTKAVELLEQGRGVFWSQLIRLRSPIEDLASSGPAGETLADEFSRLALLIQTALHSPSADQHEHVWRLNLEMGDVVTKIRELPGHSRFLLPSLFSDLQQAAEGGPIIIVNASKYSCDALIILLDRDPVHIPLQITQQHVRELAEELSASTKFATKHNATKQLAFVLRKIWDQIASPIVDFLQTIRPTRIWWCPTAEFSQLPLHAAGPFRKGQKNLPDLYISSYTPTLTALIRARRPHLMNPTPDRKRFVAIGQQKAADQSELPTVRAELDIIDQRVSSLSTFTRVDGEECCVAKVVEELSKNEWVHFSCHGLPDPARPFESAFALGDGRFTIQQIIACDLKSPEFAYLSACHTTVGYKESADEVIHLASAMQFAGFRSVIGTMWAVDDGETDKIASTFYKYMVDECGRLDHTRAAYALNMTMKSVRIPFDQRILYIHLGA